MTSIGKVQAALTAATQETTLALANFNFDFSLVKVEAPAEYKELGASLSKVRRSAAESGDPHVIARRLGSLFKSILPSVPNLIRAYGQRASEISKSPVVNPKGTKSHGAFQAFVGMDGTSIWAAATSGEGAVAVHLLACMLASVWSPSEATSIWEELVTERKRQLDKNANSEFILMEDLAAAQLSVSKDQLLNWDASARAWLRAADGAQVTEKRQRQLMLILKNINLPVNNRQQVYSSVTETWKTALETVDKVIGGAAYSVRDGAVLVALSAWHLYPDIVVLGRQNQEIQQHDDLIEAGGVVTIGLTGNDSEARKGVYWSLSLAHLRYYGPPVIASRSVASDSGRLSISNLMQVVLGAMIGSWGIEKNQVADAMELLYLVDMKIKEEIERHPHSAMQKALMESSWIRLLAAEVIKYRKSTSEDVEIRKKLVSLGLRRARFLIHGKCGILGLEDVEIVNLMSRTADKIKFLREQAVKATPSFHPDSLLIRVVGAGQGDSTNAMPEQAYYTSAMPVSNGVSPPRHFRWVPSAYGPRDDTLNDNSEHVVEFDHRNIQIMASNTVFSWKNPPSTFSAGNPSDKTTERQHKLSSSNKYSSWLGSKRKKEHAEQAVPEHLVEYHFVAGSLHDVALFERVEIQDSLSYGSSQDRFPPLKLKDILDLVRSGGFSRRLLLYHLANLGHLEPHWELIASLRAVASCLAIYENLPGATISPNIVDRPYPLHMSTWASGPDTHDFSAETGWCVGIGTLLPRSLSRSSAFAAVCMLESGTLDIDPAQLDLVMAISSGDSLYVAAPLLCDPATNLQPYDIRRVIGNIGRSGLALLIPPQNPRIRSPNPELWNVINHADFDGKLEDCFGSTSLHLSFSGYEFPLVVGDHGGRFVEAFYIESMISVHESGKWIADVDALKALLSPQLNAIVQQPHCESKPAGHPPGFEVTSIDNWEELLDSPSATAVIRAHGNWQARLAATAVSVSLGHPTILFQGHGCWSCGLKTLQNIEKARKEVGKSGDTVAGIQVPNEYKSNQASASEPAAGSDSVIFIL